MMKKKIKDCEVADVKKYCKWKRDNVRAGFCAACPFKLNNLICIHILFVADADATDFTFDSEDITTRHEVQCLNDFKQICTNLDEEINIL